MAKRAFELELGLQASVERVPGTTVAALSWQIFKLLAKGELENVLLKTQKKFHKFMRSSNPCKVAHKLQATDSQAHLGTVQNSKGSGPQLPQTASENRELVKTK